MKTATRNRLRIFYMVFAPLFLMFCLSAIFVVVFYCQNGWIALPLWLPTSISAVAMWRCANWLN